MKTLIAIFALLIAIPALAQNDTSVPVPADKMEAAGKPFIGTWNGLSCQEKVAGIRFKFEQPKPTEAPTATIIQSLFEGKLESVNEVWGTVAFNTRKNYNLLFITNNTLLVSVTVVNGRLLGLASTPPKDGNFPLLFAPAGDTSLEDFVKVTSNLCTDGAARKKFFGL